MSDKKTMTRKEIAELMEVSDDYVRKHETAIGLDRARINLPGRAIRYSTETVRSLLAARGYLFPAQRSLAEQAAGTVS